MEQGAFAAAAGTDDSQKLAWDDREGGVAENTGGAVGFAEMVSDENRRSGGDWFYYSGYGAVWLEAGSGFYCLCLTNYRKCANMIIYGGVGLKIGNRGG